MWDFFWIILNFITDIFYWKSRDKIIENQPVDFTEDYSEEQPKEKEGSNWEDFIGDEDDEKKN